MIESIGQLVNQSTAGKPSGLGEPCEQSGDRVHQHVLPDQPADRRHDEERRKHHHANERLAVDLLIHQQRDKNSAADTDDQHGNNENQRIDQGAEEVWVG